MSPCCSSRWCCLNPQPATRCGRPANRRPSSRTCHSPPTCTRSAGPNTPRPAWPAGPQLVLTNGDRLAATVIGGDGRGVWVQTSDTGGNAGDHLNFPFPAVAAVWFVAPPADTPPDVSRYPWADGPKRTDAVLLADGDVRRGVVEAFAAGGVKLSKAGLLPKANLAAVAFDPSLSRAKPNRRPAGAGHARRRQPAHLRNPRHRGRRPSWQAPGRAGGDGVGRATGRPRCPRRPGGVPVRPQAGEADARRLHRHWLAVGRRPLGTGPTATHRGGHLRQGPRHPPADGARLPAGRQVPAVRGDRRPRPGEWPRRHGDGPRPRRRQSGRLRRSGYSRWT